MRFMVTNVWWAGREEGRGEVGSARMRRTRTVDQFKLYINSGAAFLLLKYSF